MVYLYNFIMNHYEHFEDAADVWGLLADTVAQMTFLWLFRKLSLAKHPIIPIFRFWSILKLFQSLQWSFRKIHLLRYIKVSVEWPTNPPQSTSMYTLPPSRLLNCLHLDNHMSLCLSWGFPRRSSPGCVSAMIMMFLVLSEGRRYLASGWCWQCAEEDSTASGPLTASSTGS